MAHKDNAMSTEIGAYEAKTRLAELLRRAEQGERFTVTNRGKPVAQLVPRESSQDGQVSVVIGNILKNIKRTATDAELQAMKAKGRP